MDDVRESLSASYIRSDGKAITKIPRDSAIGKVVSKMPDHVRKTFVKIINNPVVQSITFATIAYQFGYSINEIVKGNHHPLNYYWTASSGIKLASMSIKPISVGVSSAMKGISSATKILRGLSTASKVLGRAAVVTMVADVLITIGVEIHERMEYTKAIAEQVPLLPGNEQAEVFFNWKDAGQRYEGIIRVKGYLDYIKDRAIQLLSAYNIAAVVQHVANIKEGYFITFDINTRNWEKRYLNISFDSIGMNFGTWINLSSLNISKTLPMTLHALVMDEGWERFKCEFAFSARFECHRGINEKVVYIVNTDAKHVPHLTKYEYENLGLRIVSAPLECQVRKPQCDPQSAAAKDSAISKARRFMVNYNNEAYTDCTNTFTLSSEPFIFTNITRSNSSPIIYLSGPNQLIAAENYPAVMHVPKGRVDYEGSKYHDNTFIINYDTYGHIRGGIANNTIVMNYNTSNIFVGLNSGTIDVAESRIELASIGTNMYNYISNSTANQNIITGCKTRYIDAGGGGGSSAIWNDDADCRDEDYEIRKVNKKNMHFRGIKQVTFIVDENSDGASIRYNNFESKNNLDTILIKNIDIAQLKINEHQADYSLELLADDKRSTVASIKIDSFKNLAIQVERYGIEKTIIVQERSLPDIIKDMEYQKLNHSGTGVSNKIMEDSKKRSKAVILANITGSEDLTAYEVAQDTINNNNLDIPISLVQVKKITGDVAHEAVVESMYSGEIVADFSHENIGCKKIITIEAGSHESKCVVKFSQACDHPIDFVLRVINNPTLYASASDQIVDLTECNINPANVECRADGEYATGIILNSRVNQGSFQIVLDSYLRGLEYQHIAFQFNKGGEFYKINSASLKLEPVLYSYEKKVEADYDSFRYYNPDEQGLRVYHNQPDNESKVGFIDLKDKSIFDSNMEIIDGSLVLLHNNTTTFMEMKNWNTNRPTRKMVFAFNETTISDLECLFSACDPEGIVEEFRKEIKKLVNKKDGYGYTKLHYATREGNLNLVTSLLDKGANIEVKDDRDRTSLDVANEFDRPEILKLLINKAVEQNKSDLVKLFLRNSATNTRYGDPANMESWTFLHYAAYNGKLSIFQSIFELPVEKRGNINHAEAYGGWTPLHVAVYYNRSDIASFLVNKGANIEARTYSNETPLDLAIRLGESEIANFLREKQSEYDNKLLAAAGSGDISEVTNLLNKGANIGARDKNGKTPLDVANENGKTEIANFLRERLDVSLFVAVNDGDINKVTNLLNGGANIGARDKSGKTPLDIANERGNTEVANFLREKQREYDNRLLTAADSGDVSEVTDLLSKGANIEAEDKDGCTPLYYAALGGQLEAARFLVDKGADINATCHTDCRKPIHIAAREGHKNVIEFFLSKGINVNDIDEHRWAPLHYTAWQGCLEVARFLVDRDANIGAKAYDGKTPLDVANQHGKLQVADFLMVKQNEYNLLLFDAAKNGDFDKVKDLTARGADVKAKDNNGKTPQDVAADKEHSNIVKYLEEKLNEERGKPVQRKRRHHHGDHPRHHSSRKLLATGLSNQPEIAASSGARPSSWINDLFSWVKEKGSLLVSGVVNSVWPASVAKLSKETSYGSTTKNNLEPIDYSQIDMNGTILLLDTFIRKFTGQKYSFTAEQPISSLEAQDYALNITEGFEKVVEQAAKDSKISIHRLDIDFMGMHKEITGKIMGGKFGEISGILISYVEKACPSREAGCPGKLSLKKFDKFMNALNNRLDLVLNQSMKQILSRDSRLEASDVKEQQISLEPKSYLNNTSVQSHLTQARDSRLR